MKHLFSVSTKPAAGHQGYFVQPVDVLAEVGRDAVDGHDAMNFVDVRIPTKSATYSNLKPATVPI